MDPELMQQLMAFLQTNPEYTTKGVPKPVSLTEQAKATNYQQDQVQSLSNPLFAALLGGGQGFDMSQFADVQDGQDTYKVPNDPMQVYAQLPDGSEEKTIATGINQGLSPEQIVSSFKTDRKYVDAPDDKALSRVRATANQMFKERGQYQQEISSVPGFDPSTGTWSVPEGGTHAAGTLTMPKYKRSDIAAIFDKAGLPTPDKRFGAADFGYDGSQQQGLQDQGAKIAALQSLVTQAAGQRDSARGHVANVHEMHHAPGQKVINPLGDFARSYDAQGKAQITDPQAIAYEKMSKLLGQQRSLERKQVVDAGDAKQAEAYANTRAKNAADHGLTPLTLAMLQRSRALQQAQQ